MALAAALGPLVDVRALPQVDPVAVFVVSGRAEVRTKGGRRRRGGERQLARTAAADDILVVRPLAPVRDRRLQPALALVVAVVHECPPAAALLSVALAAALGPLVDVRALPQVDPVAV